MPVGFRNILPPASLLLLAALAPLARGDAPEAWAIYTMNRDGSDLRAVVFVEPLPNLAAPRFSHDGARIAFDARGKQPSRALVVDATGRNLIDLGAGSRPDWSPDDKQVVFEVPSAGRPSVWVQNADGRASSWLATGGHPRWSPDGSQIAVGSPLRVFDVLTAEYHDVLIPAASFGETAGCDWSPDGQQLAAVLKRNGAHELVIASAAGDKSPRVRWRGELRGAPAWSPDGKQLAVTIYDVKTATHRIGLVEVAALDPPAPIPNQQVDGRDPAFSPDGKRLAFARIRRP